MLRDRKLPASLSSVSDKEGWIDLLAWLGALGSANCIAVQFPYTSTNANSGLRVSTPVKKIPLSSPLIPKWTSPAELT